MSQYLACFPNNGVKAHAFQYKQSWNVTDCSGLIFNSVNGAVADFSFVICVELEKNQMSVCFFAKTEYRYSKNREQSEDWLHDEFSSFNQIIKIFKELHFFANCQTVYISLIHSAWVLIQISGIKRFHINAAIVSTSLLKLALEMNRASIVGLKRVLCLHISTHKYINAQTHLPVHEAVVLVVSHIYYSY